MKKEYLGDAVYVEISRWGELTLTTEDGVNVTNTIVLEPSVLNALLEYLDARKVEAAQELSEDEPE